MTAAAATIRMSKLLLRAVVHLPLVSHSMLGKPSISALPMSSTLAFSCSSLLLSSSFATAVLEALIRASLLLQKHASRFPFSDLLLGLGALGTLADLGPDLLVESLFHVLHTAYRARALKLLHRLE